MPLQPMSRRALLPLIAAAALSPGAIMTPARAHGIAWRMYRREDLGFEVEMPGEPEVIVETGEGDDPWVRSIDAQVDAEQMTFGASYHEYQRPISPEEEALAQDEAVRMLEARIARETLFTMSGFRAREFVMESDALDGIVRMVVIDNHRIMVSVLGDRSIQTNATVRRFLDSFKVLP